MTGLQVGSFEDLLAHLDGLLEAAWSADIDPRPTRHLASVRHRLVRIQAHLTGESNPGYPPPGPQPKTLRTSEDLVTELDGIIEAARAGRALASPISLYLSNARNRLNLFLRSEEHRLASREVPEEGRAATLEIDGEPLEVTVSDRSAFGVGVITATPVDADRVAELYCPDKPQGAKRFQCVTVHCRDTGDGYHVGLEIFHTKLT